MLPKLLIVKVRRSAAVPPDDDDMPTGQDAVTGRRCLPFSPHAYERAKTTNVFFRAKYLSGHFTWIWRGLIDGRPSPPTPQHHCSIVVMVKSTIHNNHDDQHHYLTNIVVDRLYPHYEISPDNHDSSYHNSHHHQRHDRPHSRV